MSLQTLSVPHLPECPRLSIDGMSLASIRDCMTHMSSDTATETAVLSVVEQWLREPVSVEPICSIRRLMDSIRVLPRSDERLKRMNTFVRTLGQREVLATFLDIMRHSSERTGNREQELSQVSQNASKHSVYGWCGQTLLVLSNTECTDGTTTPEEGVQALMGKMPTSVWGLSMHIWQPNSHAKGFATGKGIESGAIVEPPHSHPFDFASMVSIGEMHQSIYNQDGEERTSDAASPTYAGRYDGTVLEHVYGVWPPHYGREPGRVVTREARVVLRAGDSYYMPCDTIHDVEIDARTASTRPTITLFLGSEAVVKPHVYMAPAMADFHDANPDLECTGRALSPDAWKEKLSLVSAYLRGLSPTLTLQSVVNHNGEYAFFHS